MKWFFFVLLLVLDFASKTIALEWIPPLEWGDYPFGGVPIFSNLFGISFSLNTIFNTGAAWGLFAENAGLLFVLRITIITIVGLYLYFYRHPIIKMPALWLVATGAIGNAIDYLLYGHVVDFLHLVFWGYSFPIFNLADSYITLGVVALILRSFQPKSLSKSSSREGAFWANVRLCFGGAHTKEDVPPRKKGRKLAQKKSKINRT